MNTPAITLVAFGHLKKGFPEKISGAVISEFNCTVQLKDAHIELSEFYDAGRRQYNGDSLLKTVDSLILPGTDKIIGLFDVDLFIPILTFIYGQAQLGGRSAIASLYRLSNERYGMLPDEISLLDRFKKEVIHELGHTFGLIHCTDSSCVMRSSTYVEDIDQKEAHLCRKCRDLIEKS